MFTVRTLNEFQALTHKKNVTKLRSRPAEAVFQQRCANARCSFGGFLHNLWTLQWLLSNVCPHPPVTQRWPPSRLPVLALPIQKSANDSSAHPIANQTQEALGIFDPLWTIMPKVQDKYFPSPLISHQTLSPFRTTVNSLWRRWIFQDVSRISGE